MSPQIVGNFYNVVFNFYHVVFYFSDSYLFNTAIANHTPISIENVSPSTVTVASHEWVRSIQQDINNKTNSSLYVYYNVPPGRLGNQLFGYTSTFGIAHHSNRQFAYKSDLKRLNHLLPNLNLNKTALTSWIKWTKRQEKKMLYFDERFFNLPETNVTIGGYLQSFKYFENVSEEIFKTYSDINQQLLEKVKSFKESVHQEARKRLS